MNSYQSKIVALCLILADSVWLYSIFAVVGVIVSLERSPLAYVACFVAYASSLYISQFLNFLNLRFSIAVVLQMLSGSVICYYLIGVSNIPDERGFSIFWVLNIDQWDYESGEVGLSIALATLMSAFMWVKGGLSGSSDFLLEAMFSTFRIGIIVMAFTVTVDIFHVADLSMSTLMYVFFAASLSGLAIGRIKPSSDIDKPNFGWFKIVSFLVVAVILVGVLFASLSKDLLGTVSSPITTLISWIAMGIVYLIAIPIIYLIQFVIKIFSWVLGDPNLPDQPAQQQQPVEGIGNVLEGLVNAPVSEEPSAVMQYFEYAAIFILVMAFILVLGIAFRRINRPQKVSDAGTKSEIEGSEGSLSDLFDIAKRLLRREGYSEKKDFVIPDHLDDKSKTILGSYYRLLYLGSKNGLDKSSFATPKEFQPFLSRIFDVIIVKKVTNAFARVCYGAQTPSVEEVEEVTKLMDDLDINKN